MNITVKGHASQAKYFAVYATSQFLRKPTTNQAFLSAETDKKKDPKEILSGESNNMIGQDYMADLGLHL